MRQVRERNSEPGRNMPALRGVPGVRLMVHQLNLRISKKSRLKLRVTGKKQKRVSATVNLDLGEAVEFGKKILKVLPK